MDYNISLNISFTGSTMNNTTSDGLEDTFHDYPLEFRIALLISWIELVLIAFLNSFLIIILLRRKRKSRMAFFVLNMSISDLAVAVFYLLPDVFMRTTEKWISQSGENVTCILYQYLSHVVVYASTYILVVLSIDRLYVLAQPLQSSRRGALYKYSMIVAAWLIACALALPQPITGAVTRRYGDYYLCDLDYSTATLKKALTILFVCVILIVPTIVLTVCYISIVVVIWNRKQAFGRIEKSNRYCNMDSSTNVTNGGASMMSRARIRSVEMTFVVVSVFFVCWCPFALNLLLTVHNLISFGGYYYILMALAPLNSAANPLVFLIFNYNMITPCDTKRDKDAVSTASTALLQSSKYSPNISPSRKEVIKENGIPMNEYKYSNKDNSLHPNR